jgi:adenylate cyclase
MQVLIAEDDPTSRLILQRCIEKEGHTCWVASTGDEAWLIYQTRPIDVVISDWLMPGMDGLELCQRVRNAPGHGYPYVILLTSLGDKEHRRTGMLAGADDYLSKPLDRDELRLRLIAAERVTTLHHRLHFHKDQLERLNEQLVEEKARAEDLAQHLEQRVLERTRQLQASNEAFSRFVPVEFLRTLGYEDITAARLGDATERSMTILFADVHHFTRLSESLSPEDTLSLLNRCFSRLGPCIRRHGGFIDKYIGDAIMALFPGDPRKALLAAADMQRAMVEHAVASQASADLSIGIGIHTGPVMMGTVGDEVRFEATVISDAVNLAARVESLTREFQCGILFTDSVELHLQSEDRELSRWLGRVPVKGKSRAIAVHEYFSQDDEETIRHKRTSRDMFERAVGLVLRNNPSGGASLLDQILATHPGDGPAAYWRSRALEERARLESGTGPDPLRSA